ncbi:hypothetical protein GWR56_04865 [Mucilaginibacter sp. 14171R-50]|uniref:anti-sigma factor family protein n=1 Tax=Mucilaginibacter sp. 14171R-50 TaxID=2703789 RepID=UPI00138B9C01|nr:hypothetical protein [Mucilaginibacter sp. 14171R-50]QHS54910.1 hypothetical protein GWR56_04865 [Mucilaginibacter sp. 14171R-50]
MNKLTKILYNCRKATFMIEKRMEQPLSLQENFELRLHLITCGVCRLYIKQSRKIDIMVKQLLKGPPPANIRLDDNFKRELKLRIDNELNKS